jgi:beta-lactamase class A
MFANAKEPNNLDLLLLKSLDNVHQKVNFNKSDIAISLINLSDEDTPQFASLQGEKEFYPASVIKLFLLVAAQKSIKEGKLKETAELKEAIERMISISSNDATGYVMDLLTETTSGPELSEKDFKQFVTRREIINCYFKDLGYNKINILHKPAYDKRYGREAQIEALGKNVLTTNTTAKLLLDIVNKKVIDVESSQKILSILQRNLSLNSIDPDDQAKAFIAKYLPVNTKYYSKAGWTGQVRHDAAYIELPNNTKYILVIFTQNHSKQTELIPLLSKEIASNFSKSN